MVFGAFVLALETAATVFWSTRYPLADVALGAVLFLVPALAVADLARRGTLERGAAFGVPLVFAVLVAGLVAQVVTHAQASHPNLLRDVSWPITQYLAGTLGWLVLICTALVILTAMVDLCVMLVAWVMADALEIAAVPSVSSWGLSSASPLARCSA